MRLGELKNILDRVLSEDNKIVLEAIQKFGGQAYEIENYADVVNALLELKTQDWNNTASGPFDEIVTKYGDSSKSQLLTNPEYNSLVQYVSAINTKLPLFYSIVENMVDIQNEQIINIKLPDKNDFSLEELSAINDRLDKMFKGISIDGGYTFKGFDIGTSWYEILLIGGITYKFFIAALKIAKEYFQAEKAYYESGEAKIHYEAAKADADAKKKLTDAEIQKYAKKVINSKIDMAIEQTIDDLPTKGEKGENANKLKITVTAITNELNHGLEFHLSLNPPKYVDEENDRILIDYDEIRKIEAEKNKPKQIEKPNEDVAE